MRALLLVALAIGVVNANPACYQIDLDLQVSLGMKLISNQDLIKRMLFRVPILTMGYQIWSQALPYASNHVRLLQDAPSGRNSLIWPKHQNIQLAANIQDLAR